MYLRGANFRRFFQQAARCLQYVILIALLASCNSAIPVVSPNLPGPDPSPAPIDYPKAEVTFEVTLPAALHDGQNLFIEFLDEVTGLALNASRAKMEAVDDRNYTITIPVAVNSVVKYRYVRDNDSFDVEYTSLDQQVRYRLFFVDGPGVARDIVGAWKNIPLDSATLGRLRGQVSYKNNTPVVNALVAAGGMTSLTASDGSFVIEGLMPGLHTMVVYSLNGAFQPFKQEVVIAPESTTPASIQVESGRLVNITFVVRPPADNMRGIPIRMVGNLVTLGNTFADLRGGVSTLASRAPLMDVLPDGRYTLTLKLPVGLDLRYKYTLGDGFWNSERGAGGELRIRQFIVPGRDTTVEDAIDTWRVGDLAPVSFTVTAPANTLPSDTVSIQFNPFGWTEPIPMWPIGSNRWLYVLYNPLEALDAAAYRFCRNDQCGLADAANASGTPLQITTEAQQVEETISEWAWMNTPTESIVVPGTPITPRGDSFLAGVALLPGYHPSWQAYLGGAFQNIRDIGSNTIVLTPTWHATHQSAPVLEPVAGQDPLWFDLTGMAVPAQQRGLGIVIQPVLRYEGDAAEWWQSAPRDEGWWQTWFDRYRAFLIYHADLAAQTGAKAMIIGDPSIQPALPGGLLPDGSSANTPADIEARWRDLIADIRAHYPGKLMWFVPYTGAEPSVPPFLSDVDMLYVQISPPVSSSDDLAPADMETTLAAALDTSILKLQEQAGQPVVLGLEMPSTAGSLDGCVEGEEGACLPFSALQQPTAAENGLQPDLKLQADLYGAALSVVNGRSWISGFFAVGYYAPVGLKDASVSVRSKPASDVLWYWYPRFLGQVTP